MVVVIPKVGAKPIVVSHTSQQDRSDVRQANSLNGNPPNP
jgi:hypothetical protein